MEQEIYFNYFYNLISNSLNSVNSKNELNHQNNSSYLPSLLQDNSKLINYLKNYQVNIPATMVNHRLYPKEYIKLFNGQMDEFSKNSLIKILQQQRTPPKQIEARSNIDQSIKTQNLNNILNKIHSFKQSDRSFTKVPEIDKDNNQASNMGNKEQQKTKEMVVNEHSLNTTQNNESPNKKTVRQLLEERQTYIQKLKWNQMEIIKCQLNAKGMSTKDKSGDIPIIPTIIKVPKPGTSILPRQPTTQVVDKHISKECSKSVVNIITDKTLVNDRNVETIAQQEKNQAHFNTNYDRSNKFEAQPPKKGLTVRELLERKRNPNQLGEKHQARSRGRSQKRHHASFHPYLESKSFIQGQLKKVNTQNNEGLTPNNPIVLSDEESNQSSIISFNSSIITDKSEGSDHLAQPFYGYDLYSEHNYIMDPNLVIKAKEVLNDLNQELYLSKLAMNNSNKDMDDIIEEISSEQKKRVIENMDKNHENYDEKEFAKSLNLIKSRDLRRTSIAYLNARWPPNVISRSIYAGLETKSAVLDFPRQQIKETIHKLSSKNNRRQNIINYKNDNILDTKSQHLNNWSQVLENLDFSSPLSQKIIKIFPEYQSKRLRRKAFKRSLKNKHASLNAK